MTRTSLRLRAALAPTLALGLVAGFVLLPATADAVAAPVTTLDYYKDAYPGLGGGSVFEAVTNERFGWLLQQPGTYAVLVGGPEAGDPTNVSAEISAVDDVAKQAGVTQIVNWDPHTDGAANPLLDVRTSTDPAVAAVWTQLTSSLNAGGTGTFTGASTDPYLFVYDKDHTANGSPAPIVAALNVRHTAGELADPTVAAAYRSAVHDVLTAVPHVDTTTSFQFWKSQANGKHTSRFTASLVAPQTVATQFGAPVIPDDADDAGFRIETITYPELVDLLKSDGRYTILFGGTWCPNTRAVVADINSDAQQNGVQRVYQFDWHQYNDNDDNETHLDLRQALPTQAKPAGGSPFNYLYGDVVNTYLTNLQTQYGSRNQNWISYYPGNDSTQTLVKAQKLQVPTLFTYQKGASGGPVVRHWIQDIGDGTFTEYMTNLWFVQAVATDPTDFTKFLGTSQPRDATPLSASAKNSITTSRLFAAGAVKALSNFFAGIDGHAPAVTTQPTAAAVETGRTATFTAAASGTPATSVQWQTSADGTAWLPVTGWTSYSPAGSAGYAVPGATLAQSGTKFRAVFINGVGTPAISAAVTLTVADATATPSPSASSTPTPSASSGTPTPSASTSPSASASPEPSGSATTTSTGHPSGTPNAPAGDSAQLPAGSKGGFSLTQHGTSVTITVPGAVPGAWYHVYGYSTPTALGWFQVGANGTFTVDLVSLGGGSHYVAVQNANGSLVGWVGPVTLADPGTGLASTGTDALALAGVAVVLLVAGAVLVVAFRRRGSLPVA